MGALEGFVAFLRESSSISVEDSVGLLRGMVGLEEKREEMI